MKVALLLIIGAFCFGVFQDDCASGALLSYAKNHLQPVPLAIQQFSSSDKINKQAPLPSPTGAASPSPLGSPQQVYPPVNEPSLDWYQNFGPGKPDLDCDGIWNSKDNCVFIYNPDQKDSDGDGNGDACDSSLVDPASVKDHCDEDGDGVPDRKDNCPLVCNPDQKDRNKNGVGDICDDAFPHPVLKLTLCNKPSRDSMKLHTKVSNKKKN
jgi:hypothetical protein